MWRINLFTQYLEAESADYKKLNSCDIVKLKQLGCDNVAKKEHDEAKKYYVQAGDADAFFCLGVMYMEIIPPDYANAKKYYEKAAFMGDFRAMNNAADCGCAATSRDACPQKPAFFPRNGRIGGGILAHVPFA